MNSSPATITPPAEQVIQGVPPPPAVLVRPQPIPHGSVGTVVGVVAAIAVVGVIAGVIGRLCGRRSIMGYGGSFDIEEWAETQCSSCIDGHVGPPPPPPGGGEGGSGRGNAAAAEPTMVVVMGAMDAGEGRTEEEEERESPEG